MAARPGDAGADDEHLRRLHAPGRRHLPGEETPEVLRRLDDRAVAGDVGHRRQRVHPLRARDARDGVHRQHGHLARRQPLEQLLVLRRPDEADQRRRPPSADRPRACRRPSADRLPDLQHHVRLGVERRGVRRDASRPPRRRCCQRTWPRRRRPPRPRPRSRACESCAPSRARPPRETREDRSPSGYPPSWPGSVQRRGPGLLQRLLQRSVAGGDLLRRLRRTETRGTPQTRASSATARGGALRGTRRGPRPSSIFCSGGAWRVQVAASGVPSAAPQRISTQSLGL